MARAAEAGATRTSSARRRTTRRRSSRGEADREGAGPARTSRRDFRKMHSLYWTRAPAVGPRAARRTIPALFRALVPCDPVVTVAPDVVMFECFAKDEASYGCLSVDREALRGADQAALGTTNVDYSLALFEHFQTIRTYRPTRLLVDPAGFEVATGVRHRRARGEDRSAGVVAARLRPAPGGDGAAGAARSSCRPTSSTRSSRTCKRHREKTGPRALRFILAPGKPVAGRDRAVRRPPRVARPRRTTARGPRRSRCGAAAA